MSENLWFSDVFRVDRNGTLGGNGLTNFVMVSLMRHCEVAPKKRTEDVNIFFILRLGKNCTTRSSRSEVFCKKGLGLQLY